MVLWIFGISIMLRLPLSWKKKLLLWSMNFGQLVYLIPSSRSSSKFLPIDFILTFTSSSIKPNRPLQRINRFLIEWLVRMRFLWLYTTPILRRCSLRLILKRELMPLVRTFSLSYSWLEGLVIVGLIGLRLAWPPELLLFLLMRGRVTTYVVIRVLGKKSLSPSISLSLWLIPLRVSSPLSALVHTFKRWVLSHGWMIWLVYTMPMTPSSLCREIQDPFFSLSYFFVNSRWWRVLKSNFTNSLSIIWIDVERWVQEPSPF